MAPRPRPWLVWGITAPSFSFSNWALDKSENELSFSKNPDFPLLNFLFCSLICCSAWARFSAAKKEPTQPEVTISQLQPNWKKATLIFSMIEFDYGILGVLQVGKKSYFRGVTAPVKLSKETCKTGVPHLHTYKIKWESGSSTCFLLISLVVVGHMELAFKGLLTFTVVGVLAGDKSQKRWKFNVVQGNSQIRWKFVMSS